MSKEVEEWNNYFVENEAKFINASEKTWIQEDGICKLISEMSLDHLKNAIKYVDKKIKGVENCPISKEKMKKMKRKKQELKRMYKEKTKL